MNIIEDHLLDEVSGAGSIWYDIGHWLGKKSGEGSTRPNGQISDIQGA